MVFTNLKIAIHFVPLKNFANHSRFSNLLLLTILVRQPDNFSQQADSREVSISCRHWQTRPTDSQKPNKKRHPFLIIIFCRLNSYFAEL